MSLITRRFPWISAAALIICVALSYPARDYVVIALMLFLPLFDGDWQIPTLPRFRHQYFTWSVLLITAVVILAWRPSETPFALATFMMAALPEEWFFRAYFMMRLGQGIRANIVTSLLFSLLHGLTWGWITACLVFAPSLFYGWLYQRTRDLPLLMLVHALSNMLYAVFFAEFVTTLIGNLR